MDPPDAIATSEALLDLVSILVSSGVISTERAHELLDTTGELPCDTSTWNDLEFHPSSGQRKRFQTTTASESMRSATTKDQGETTNTTAYRVTPGNIHDDDRLGASQARAPARSMPPFTKLNFSATPEFPQALSVTTTQQHEQSQTLPLQGFPQMHKGGSDITTPFQKKHSMQQSTNASTATGGTLRGQGGLGAGMPEVLLLESEGHERREGNVVVTRATLPYWKEAHANTERINADRTMKPHIPPEGHVAEANVYREKRTAWSMEEYGGSTDVEGVLSTCRGLSGMNLSAFSEQHKLAAFAHSLGRIASSVTTGVSQGSEVEAMRKSSVPLEADFHDLGTMKTLGEQDTLMSPGEPYGLSQIQLKGEGTGNAQEKISSLLDSSLEEQAPECEQDLMRPARKPLEASKETMVGGTPRRSGKRVHGRRIREEGDKTVIYRGTTGTGSGQAPETLISSDEGTCRVDCPPVQENVSKKLFQERRRRSQLSRSLKRLRAVTGGSGTVVDAVERAIEQLIYLEKSSEHLQATIVGLEEEIAECKNSE